MNVVVISGNLVRDPEGAVTATGKTYSRFDLAVNEFYNGKETTTYVRCSCWDKQADYMNSHTKKGDNILVQGRLRTYEFTMKNGVKKGGLEVSVTLVEKSKAKSNNETFDYSYNDAMENIKEPTLPTEDDDIPF